ncbi:DUF5682 family protein [Streptomyces roseicoloratus]|uniref:DUF5682 family protein n=1 Tax=Streptomyces roseicoloratus TaxID=2508722 RepID=UPI001009C826|nr:DUF5682 family protein [Streptomyces roseicoloratus]
MTVTYLGVRHHSPACARLVARTIAELRPAHVLVEGPADLNGRLDELLLGHELPVAVFSHYRDAERAATSWTPLCDYSPEWIALTHGRAAGADVRFIDLPAWHPAFEGRANRYADAEARYADATARLCRRFGVDSVDALWDRMVEADPDAADLTARLDAYFDVVRGDTEADAPDRAREEYMASWVRAARAATGDRPILVVTGGFHRPAIRRLAERPPAPGPAAGGGAVPGDRAAPAEAPASAAGAAPTDGPAPALGPVAAQRLADGEPAPPADGPVPGERPTPATAPVPAQRPADGGRHAWPEVPAAPEDALAGSFLVPYSFRQLDAFAGYESGMPSPAYHQWLWEDDREAAGDRLVRSVVGRLRERGHPVSTASLVAARTSALALAALRGHPGPTRLDLLDGLAGALVTEALDEPLPWTRRGPLRPGTHPAVVAMVAACGGERVGRLHPDTPVPPLVHDVTTRLAALGLDTGEPVTIRLTEPSGLERSRVLHRLRVLGVPGHERVSGPSHGTDPVVEERWEPRRPAGREAALIEAGSFGASLDEAAVVALGDRATAAGSDCGRLAEVLFDTVACGATELTGDLVARLRSGLAAAARPGPLGTALATALGLWRHDRVYGVARDPLLGGVVDTAVSRVLWLVEGAGGATAPAGPDRERLGALAAVRDAYLHAGALLTVPRGAAVDVFRRVSRDPLAPPDLRGAAFGLCRVLAPEHPPAGHGTRAPRAGRPAPGTEDAAVAVRDVGEPRALGDWLAGLFAVAREELGATSAEPGPLVAALDDLVTAMTETDFLVALPSLRDAFAYFPPAEREQIAARLIARRGLRGSSRALLRTTADPMLIARARELEDHVSRTLDRFGLGAAR